MVVSNVLARALGKMGVILETDGSILISCTTVDQNSMLMAQFLDDGTLDTSFGTDGVSLIAATSVQGNASIQMADGSTLQFGQLNNLGIVGKRDAGGDPDASFGTGGILSFDAGIPAAQAFLNGALLPNGRIIAYGSDASAAFVAKLTPDPITDGLPVITDSGSDLITTTTGDIQWYLDDLPIDGATSSTYTPTENGSYTVTVTNGDCALTSEPFVVLSVGIQEIDGRDLRILEDPVTNTLTLMNDAMPSAFNIIDRQGRIVLSGRIDSGRNDIDLQNMSSGVYLLRTSKNAGGLRFVVL